MSWTEGTEYKPGDKIEIVQTAKEKDALKSKRYRERNREVLKVAKHLQISVAAARALCRER